jgi:hypothetical protein
MKPQEIIIRVVVEQATPPAPAPVDGLQEVGERSMSQKLRLTLLRLYKSRGMDESEFEDYYKARMAAIIKTIERQI